MLAHSTFQSRGRLTVSGIKMIAEDISKGKENVKVPVVNELNDEKPSEFRVIITKCVISIPRVRSQLQTALSALQQLTVVSS